MLVLLAAPHPYNRQLSRWCDARAGGFPELRRIRKQNSKPARSAVPIVLLRVFSRFPCLREGSRLACCGAAI
jgi:hypothetical protein